MAFSQGCLFISAYLSSGTKTFGAPQTQGTPINYSGDGTPSWSNPSVQLLSQAGVNFNVPVPTLLQVFPVVGSGNSATVSINKSKLDQLSATNSGKVWDAFTGNGRLQLTVSTSLGNKLVRIELRALKSANYELTCSTRSAACVFPSGCSSPDFNFTGDSASNYAAQFQVSTLTLVTASFAPDNFSIPDSELPSPGSYENSTLTLTRSFTTDSSGNPVNPYSVQSTLPSNFGATS